MSRIEGQGGFISSSHVSNVGQPVLSTVLHGNTGAATAGLGTSNGRNDGLVVGTDCKKRGLRSCKVGIVVADVGERLVSVSPLKPTSC